MFNFFVALFKHRKPRIIPFNTCRQPELEGPKETPGNQCKILSFKYHNGYLTDPRLAAGNETGSRDLENPGQCKLYFIWDHLPANHSKEPSEMEKIWAELCKERGDL